MPVSLQAQDASGVTLQIELTLVDSLSCSFSELVLYVPNLKNAPFPMLQQWASELSRQVTYLLEPIGPLEFDPTNGQILVRSIPAAPHPQGSQYYEILLTTSGNGTFTLRRYRSIAGQSGRVPAEIQVTNEVLFRLVDDLIRLLPSTP